jgi:hypothetical protein
MSKNMKLIFERGAQGRRAASLPNCDVPEYEPPVARMLRQDPLSCPR